MPRRASEHARPFRILTVCTGNVCRSPLAQALLRLELPPELFSVSSAGTAIGREQPVPEPQLRIARELGIEGLEEHRSRPLVAAELDQYDLILGMSRNHRRFAVQKAPRTVRKTFTLREFAHLAAHVTPEDLELARRESPNFFSAAVEAVSLKRGMVPPVASNSDLDVVDPFNKRKADYRMSRDQLVPAAHTAAAYLNRVVELFRQETNSVQSPSLLAISPTRPGEPTALDRMAKRALTLPTDTQRRLESHNPPTGSHRQVRSGANTSSTIPRTDTNPIPTLPKRSSLRTEVLPNRIRWRSLHSRKG